jgi:hypothetical protein
LDNKVVMSKKPLTKSCTRVLTMCQYLVIPSLMLGFGPRVSAQPDSTYTWNYSISFSGNGTIPVSESSHSDGNSADDPAATATLTGTGTDVDTYAGPNTYNVVSTLSATADVSISTGLPSSAPFSISAPTTGPDPGLSFTTGNPPDYTTYQVTTSPLSPPFYNLFPPPTGTDWTAFIGPAALHYFAYNSTVLWADFGYVAGANDGEVDLVLGDTPTVTEVGDSYTFSYANSDLYADVDINESEPTSVFTGTVDITVVAATAVPDSSPGLVGILALLGVCVCGAWQKRTQAA